MRLSHPDRRTFIGVAAAAMLPGLAPLAFV